jgi:hypothetical protein
MSQITGNEIIRNEQNFIGYEYREVSVKRELESLYTDGYSNFGWEYDGNGASVPSINAVIMKFKRDRKIRNKAELSRLQRQFDVMVGEIDTLEKTKTSVMTISQGVFLCDWNKTLEIFTNAAKCNEN